MIRWLRSLFQKKMFAEILVGDTYGSPDQKASPRLNADFSIDPCIRRGFDHANYVEIRCTDSLLPFIYSRMNRYLYLANSSADTWTPVESNGVVVFRFKATDDLVSFVSGCLLRQGVNVSHGVFNVDRSFDKNPHLTLNSNGSVNPPVGGKLCRNAVRDLHPVS